MIFHIYPVGLLHCTVLGKGPWSYRTGKNHDREETRVKAASFITATSFWPKLKLSQSFYYLKNSFNSVTLSVRPDVCAPLVTRFDRVPLLQANVLLELSGLLVSVSDIFHILLVNFFVLKVILSLMKFWPKVHSPKEVGLYNLYLNLHLRV